CMYLFFITSIRRHTISKRNWSSDVCSSDLMAAGPARSLHEVTLLEASGRPGGHVRTIHDPLPDGLYADVGAEHFTQPGYDLYRQIGRASCRVRDVLSD